ncbi:RHS repeat-associated core domain-containing protein [Acidipila rosea]|uniref:RHS repeat-associated core domain-containing protein n=1 Tax=Acidipila rosea TaxID=768535 RepID=UPI001404488A|nr:RHS repeat-associated core domain-containing protein [Acidipila rosea]
MRPSRIGRQTSEKEQRNDCAHSITAPTQAKTLEWNTRLQIAYRSVNGTTYFEHKNWLGTERLRTDYTGATAATYQSLSFGDGYTPNILQSAADQDNNHFATLDHDSETATEHAQFRQYASAQGLWMSPDPYMGSYDLTNPQSFNRYSYVGNMPMAFTDLLGLDYGFDCGPDCVGVVGTGGSGGGLVGGTPGGPAPILSGTERSFGGYWFPAPNNQNRLHCAAQFANQFSIAGITGLDNYHGFGSTFLNAALGNTFSGFVDAFDAGTGQNGKSGFDLYPMGVAGGPLLGIPLPDSASPGLQGPLNTALAPAINAATTTSVTTLAGETAIGDSMAFPLAAAKFALDGLTFAAGYIGCHP